MRGLVLVAAVVGGAVVADAEPDGSTRRAHVAIAVNSPLSWSEGFSHGGSLYVGFAEHHAVRINAARYKHASSVRVLIGDLFFGGDGDDAVRTGRFLDGSLGYMYWPRTLWSGPLFEAAVLVRDTDTVTDNSFATPEYVEVHSMTIAGRGLVGWSWLFYDHVFVSFAVGISAGREIGEETTSQSSYDFMPSTRDVSRPAVRGEGFLRIGGAFDL